MIVFQSEVMKKFLDIKKLDSLFLHFFAERFAMLVPMYCDGRLQPVGHTDQIIDLKSY